MAEINHFFRVKTTGFVADKLAKVIASHLKREEVLWLLSGGSVAKVAVECSSKLRGADLSRLTVSLADERLGPVGHPDSNWKQLIEAGFSLPGATLHPLLVGRDIRQAIASAKDFFNKTLSLPAYKIALLGMGADGHTAGILPGSPAIKSDEAVVAYRAGDFERLTLGLSAISNLDEAFLYAKGPDKAGQLADLAAKDIDPRSQPAQIIKRLPNWWVYNDRIGEEI